MPEIRLNGINYSSGGGIGGSGDTIVVGDEWKYFCNLPTPSNGVTTTAIDLPEDYSEILVELVSANYGWVSNISFSKEQLLETAKTFHDGYYDGTYVMSTHVEATDTKIIKCGFQGSDKLGSGKVYYKAASTHILNPNEDDHLELIAKFEVQGATAEVDLSKYNAIVISASNSGGIHNASFTIGTSDMVVGEKYGVNIARPLGIIYTSEGRITSFYTTTWESGDLVYVYGIKDNGGVTISKKDIYSTEEQEIGTWIDGKPIYRKTITGTLASVSNSLKLLPIDKVINAYGLTETSYNHTMFIPSGTVDNSATGSGAYGCQLLKHTNGSEWFLQYGTSNNPNGSTVLTVEYTKTIN